VTSNRLAPLRESVAWDLANRLERCNGLLVIADLAIAIMLYRMQAIVKDLVGWITLEGERASEEAQ
jgi:hypothetical protein